VCEGKSAKSGRREKERTEEGRESSGTLGRGKEKRATSPAEQRRREGVLFIGDTSEQERERQEEREKERESERERGTGLVHISWDRIS